LPPEFQIRQYQPRPWRPADSIIIGKSFAEALSTTWPLDLARALLADLPPAKRDYILSEYTPLDVLVVGNDDSKTLKRAQAHTSAMPANAAARAQLLDDLARVMETTEQTLALIGLSAPERAASNNWVVSGRHT